MANGNSFLREIEASITAIERQAESNAETLDRLRHREASLWKAVNGALLKIAQVQMAALDQDEITGYDKITRTVDDRLIGRDQERKALEKTIAALEKAVERSRQKQVEAEGQVEAAANAVESLTGRVDAELAAAPAFVALRDSLNTAVSLTDRAAKKAAGAKAERDEKAGAYRADPLFAYLLERGFGTEAYTASPVVRTIDSWVARLCGFHTARQDYQLLMMLPDYLGGHADQMDAAREKAEIDLGNYRAEALKAAGLESLVTALQAETADLEAIRDAAADDEKAISRERAARRAFERWEDPESQAVLKLLSQAMSQESIDKIQERVRMTADTTDDAAAKTLADASGEIQKSKAAIEEASRASQSIGARLADLKTTRSRFRKKGYASSDYKIRGSSASSSLEGFLAGAISESQLWGEIDRSVRYDPPPRYTPSSSSSSSSSSGEFGSGGGFGGGGFSTGGGF